MPDTNPKETYLALSAELWALIDAGLGDSPEADALRDKMDAPWYAMTPEEREEAARRRTSVACPEHGTYNALIEASLRYRIFSKRRESDFLHLLVYRRAREAGGRCDRRTYRRVHAIRHTRKLRGL